MKHKLKLDDLAVASFSAEEDPAGARGTVRGASADTLEPYESCVVAQTCIAPCGEPATRGTCYDSCVSCRGDDSCYNTCLRDTC